MTTQSTQTVLIGNLTAAPTKRHTTDGRPVAGLRIAVTPRVQDSAGAWTDGPTQFTNASVFGQQARNVVSSLQRGDRVILTGRMDDNEFTPTTGPNAGVTRNEPEMMVSEVGASLQFAVATPERTRRTPEASTSEVA